MPSTLKSPFPSSSGGSSDSSYRVSSNYFWTLSCPTFSCSFSLVSVADWDPNKLNNGAPKLLLGLLKLYVCAGIWKLSKVFLNSGCSNGSKNLPDGGGTKGSGDGI